MDSVKGCVACLQKDVTKVFCRVLKLLLIPCALPLNPSSSNLFTLTPNKEYTDTKVSGVCSDMVSCQGRTL